MTVTLFLLLVLISDQPVSSSPQPGHLVHDFYKYLHQLLNFLLELRWFFSISRCSSKFYYDFSRCKLEREEAARRGLNRRSRQIHHNSASTTGQEASLVGLALATLWTQKCLWWLFFGWGRVGRVWRKKVQIWRGCKSTSIARNRKITTIPTFWCKPVILSLRLLIVLLYTSISNRRSQRRILTTWNNKLSIVKKHLKWKHDKDNNKTDKAISVFRFSTECYREPWVPFKLRQFCNVTTDNSCVFLAFFSRLPPHKFRKIMFFLSWKAHGKQLAQNNPPPIWSQNPRIKFGPFQSVFVYIPYFDVWHF